MAQSNPPFMTGVPELLVLCLLARRETYGYELVKSVRLTTGEAISIGEGVIYPVLRGLERNGALKSKRKTVGGRTRIYYSMTDKGRRRLEQLQGEWARIKAGVSAALQSPAGGRPGPGGIGVRKTGPDER